MVLTFMPLFTLTIHFHLFFFVVEPSNVSFDILLFSQITKTTRTVNQRRLSERKNSGELPFQQPKLKTLYGRDLKDYENLNVEDLLTQLSAEELEELSEQVDPDDSLLPPSERCKDQTSKDPTGPLNRRQLLNFLTKFAKEQEDWPENKKFVTGVKLGESTISEEY